VNACPRADGTRAQPTPIDLDRHQLGSLGHAHRQPAASLGYLGIALLRQGDAHFLRQGADVLRREGQTGQLQGKGGVGERTQTAGGFRDQAPGGGAVGMVIEAKERSLGGKSPADRRDNGRPVRSV
jgi:hypothetical protein